MERLLGVVQLKVKRMAHRRLRLEPDCWTRPTGATCSFIADGVPLLAAIIVNTLRAKTRQIIAHRLGNRLEDDHYVRFPVILILGGCRCQIPSRSNLPSDTGARNSHKYLV